MSIVREAKTKKCFFSQGEAEAGAVSVCQVLAFFACEKSVERRSRETHFTDSAPIYNFLPRKSRKLKFVTKPPTNRG